MATQVPLQVLDTAGTQLLEWMVDPQLSPYNATQVLPYIPGAGPNSCLRAQAGGPDLVGEDDKVHFGVFIFIPDRTANPNSFRPAATPPANTNNTIFAAAFSGPSSINISGGGGMGGAPGQCFNCKEFGHQSRDCTVKRGLTKMTCQKCNSVHHPTRPCEDLQSWGQVGQGFGSKGGSGCRECGQEGHFAKECPNKNGGGGGGAAAPPADDWGSF
eukprot:gnl/Hemi2/25215_TR8475_c0_g1_i1.p1 gnl/Hemi2/25215_TR8475_c0_g1~~gnl/Hemi2/25215_TR8475_c0_g1_i1.p1  ORF type:complete len:215 (-),score=70.79 gnl/Hemi2/25215_TR8475_c0_g1_i1:259-903(-)